MKKRILSILLTLCMLFCLVPTGVFAEGETATGSAAIQLGTDALSKNVNTATAPTVYFGQDHENNPGAWRVIDYDGNSAAGIAGNMTLLAANNMGLSKFGASNAYADSALKEAIDALADKLTAKETDAVEKRTLASGNYDEENTDGVAGPAVSNAVFWPLSSKEANAVNNDLRVVDPEHPGWASSYWWLRSPDEDYSTAFVAGRGEVRYYGGYSTSKEFGVRPAFDLNLDSVLFASAAVGGKPDGGLQPVSPNYTGNEWKLTLYDSKRNDFSRTTWEVSASTKGGTVEISYTDAKTGANEYISALIFDDVGNVIYYGRSNASLTEKDGTAQLTIPAGFAEGTYTLKVFNEQYNGDRKTDLASGFADVTLTVEKRVDEQFTLAPGGRYYFDLSAMDIPGTVNSNLPDSTLHYVPFTYAGTVDAYSMENETDTAKQPYEHSLFIADYNVKCSLQRETLAEMNLIYGQTYTASNVNYTLRAPSVGDHHRNEGEGSGLAPIDNEWDTIYQKSADYIKNWYKMRSFGQDIGTGNVEGMYLSRGGHFAAQATFWARPTLPERDIGFRPVLEVLNTDPLISDTDRDLGDKNNNFTIQYTVNDADSGDVLTATESIDGVTKKTFSPVRGQQNTITVPVNDLSLGAHTVKVVVTDGQGGTAARTWTFRRTNSAPTISGSDTNLGDKNLSFTYEYTVDDADGDSLTVTEKLGDEVLRTVNNAPKNTPLTLTITAEKLYTLGLNSVNTITISVTDGRGGTAYRSLTFKRTNSAPVISGQDTDIGAQTGAFAENYTVTDAEGDNVVINEYLDDQKIRTYQATLGQQATIEVSRENWLKLSNGAHRLRVEAVDGNFATSVRVWNFSKSETVIAFQFSKPEATDARASKILITPTWRIEGAVAKVEVCNNAFDAVPTWEDMTAQVAINRVFNFTNETKTADSWGVSVRFTITKNEGYTGEVSISGFGGAYE